MTEEQEPDVDESLVDEDIESAVEAEPMPEEPAERVRAIVDRVLDEIDLDAEVEITETDDEIVASIDGTDELGVLIGRRGQTLDALQLLCYRAASMGVSDRKRVTIDAAGYRERRRSLLEEEAHIAAERASRNGEAVRLEPMSASERRMVHEVLKDRADVETHSEGDEPERRIVVAPLIED
ncbi:MAG: KH domain-containing protein [Solirubrobacterales bacterium]|nr:KH domain-containing protein [Solirubrobacterales bacterium]